MSIQDSKPREKQISPTFSYFLINNALLYHFLANWLAHNKKMTEKSFFRETWSPELTSQSFPVSCFWCRGFVPHRKWNLTLLAHQNRRKENRYRKNFFATLISTLGRFNRRWNQWKHWAKWHQLGSKCDRLHIFYDILAWNIANKLLQFVRWSWTPFLCPSSPQRQSGKLKKTLSLLWKILLPSSGIQELKNS